MAGRPVNLTTADALLVTLLVAVSNFIWLPIGGTLSDRFGRKPVLIAMRDWGQAYAQSRELAPALQTECTASV